MSVIHFSDYDPVQMVNFMLADLCRPSGQFHSLFLPVAIHVFDFDILIPGSLTHTFKGKTAFLRLIGRIFLHDHRIVHDQIHEAYVHNDDAFSHADHVCRHADTARFVCFQRILEILPCLDIHGSSRIRFLSEEKYIFYNWFDHVFGPLKHSLSTFN